MEAYLNKRIKEVISSESPVEKSWMNTDRVRALRVALAF